MKIAKYGCLSKKINVNGKINALFKKYYICILKIIKIKFYDLFLLIDNYTFDIINKK